jgi:perosamine synthetase
MGPDERIPVAGPWVTDLEVRYVAEAAAGDWYGNASRSVRLFEEEFAEHVGVAHAVAVPHCTSALHLALLANGIGAGDEVIVPEATWVATAAPIAYVGATPVFADIDPATWCISPASVERCLGPRTKAILTVDLYGAVPDMGAIEALAARSGAVVIEDAAQSIGSTWRGRKAGSFGSAATFSFHGTKTLTTGEGGMLVTEDGDLHARVNALRDHGRTATDFKFFVTDELAFKYKMSSLQAAFGRAQLARLPELLERKAQIFAWYEERLADLPGVCLNDHRDTGSRNTFWMVTAVVDRGYRTSTRELMAELDRRDIDSRPFFPPMSSLGAFAGYDSVRGAREANPIAYDISERAVNLPSAMKLDEGDVDRVCAALRDILVRTEVAS